MTHSQRALNNRPRNVRGFFQLFEMTEQSSVKVGFFSPGGRPHPPLFQRCHVRHTWLQVNPNAVSIGRTCGRSFSLEMMPHLGRTGKPQIAIEWFMPNTPPGTFIPRALMACQDNSECLAYFQGILKWSMHCPMVPKSPYVLPSSKEVLAKSDIWIQAIGFRPRMPRWRSFGHQRSFGYRFLGHLHVLGTRDPSAIGF
jgi:hypothetical protein